MSHRTVVDASFTCVNTAGIHHTKCEMLVSLVPGGLLPPVALCQVSHKLASTRDTRVMPRVKNYERKGEKKEIAGAKTRRSRAVTRFRILVFS